MYFIHESEGDQHKFDVLMVQTHTNRVCATSTNIDEIGWSIFKEGGKLAHCTSGAILFLVLGVEFFYVDKQKSLLNFHSFSI